MYGPPVLFPSLTKAMSEGVGVGTFGFDYFLEQLFGFCVKKRQFVRFGIHSACTDLE